jgi:hypothetical protein
MMNGREIEHPLEDGTILYFMSEEHFKQQSSISEEEWREAIRYLDSLILLYAGIGWSGSFGLTSVLSPLKARYEKGERTKELYDSIMKCE